MKVNGIIEVDVTILHKEAIESLFQEYFDNKDINISKCVVMENEGVKGVYLAQERYYCGLPDYEYYLLKKGEAAVKVFESLIALKEYWDKMERQEQTLTLKK